MKAKTTLPQKIAQARQDLKAAKPRSQRRFELELHLKRMLTQQLRFENRIERAKAA